MECARYLNYNGVMHAKQERIAASSYISAMVRTLLDHAQRENVFSRGQAGGRSQGSLIQAFGNCTTCWFDTATTLRPFRPRQRDHLGEPGLH